MDIITKDTINNLIENCEGKAVSIYMPMFIPAQEAEQNPIRLKTLVKEIAIVSDAFHVSPLISIYNGNGHFLLLSIAQEHPRLYQGSKFRLEEI